MVHQATLAQSVALSRSLDLGMLSAIGLRRLSWADVRHCRLGKRSPSAGAPGRDDGILLEVLLPPAPTRDPRVACAAVISEVGD